MRSIAAATQPSSFHYGRSSGAAYGDLSSDPAIRRALWLEQERRCAYCERRLRDPAEPGHRTKIEHFHPQSARVWTADCALCSGAADNAAAPTTWSNLLLCCNGNEGMGEKRQTCDTSKMGADICAEFRNPKRWAQAQVAIVDRAGRVMPGSGLPVGADRVIDTVLRLNTERLVTARDAIISAEARRLAAIRAREHGFTPRRRAQLAAELRARAETAEFGSALLTMANHLMAGGAGR